MLRQGIRTVSIVYLLLSPAAIGQGFPILKDRTATSSQL